MSEPIPIIPVIRLPGGGEVEACASVEDLEKSISQATNWFYRTFSPAQSWLDFGMLLRWLEDRDDITSLICLYRQAEEKWHWRISADHGVFYGVSPDYRIALCIAVLAYDLRRK